MPRLLSPSRASGAEASRTAGLFARRALRLVFYPGEGHGNRFAAHRLDYNLRMLQWFEHYLKGPGGQRPAYQIEYGDASTK